MTWRVLVIDDHPIVRAGVCGVLAATPDLLVVGEASNAQEALEQLLLLAPDVVVLDLTMPAGTGDPTQRSSAIGLKALRAIRSAADGRLPAVVVLSVHAESDIVRAALEGGAGAYVVKDSVSADLSGAVIAAAHGHLYLSAEAAATLTAPAVPAPPSAGRLSPRERQVVELIVQGLSSREIADRLHTSPKTVEKQRRDAMRKLGVTNVATLVRLAMSPDF